MTETEERLFQIDSGYYVAGIVFDLKTRRAVESAPIVRWMVGKDFEWIKGYCKRKRFIFRKVEL
jgi:hypothetical protein